MDIANDNFGSCTKMLESLWGNVPLDVQDVVLRAALHRVAPACASGRKTVQ